VQNQTGFSLLETQVEIGPNTNLAWNFMDFGRRPEPRAQKNLHCSGLSPAAILQFSGLTILRRHVH
jgi:hypothetical protein